MKIKFILVQIPEQLSESNVTVAKGKKVVDAAIALCQQVGGACNICEITKERIRRAGKKIKDDAGFVEENLDIGFRVLKLDSSNMKDVFYTPQDFSEKLLSSLEDNIKSDRTA